MTTHVSIQCALINIVAAESIASQGIAGGAYTHIGSMCIGAVMFTEI